MAEFPPKTQHDQVLAFVAILGLAGIVVYYALVWRDRSAELDLTQARVEKLVAINDTAKREMARGTLKQLEADAERLRGDLEVVRTLVPTGNEVPMLLDQVSNAARRAGLDLSDVQPEPVLRGYHFDAYRYRMAVVGDFHQMGDFLANVGTLTRIVTPMNLSLEPAKQTTGRRVREGQQFLLAKFQIQTYVAKTTSAPPATGGAQ